MISNIENRFIIGRIPRKDEMDLPSVYINDIDTFEVILENYVETIKRSDTFYNIFSSEKMMDISFHDKLIALFSCTMFNATSTDLIFTELFFRKYTHFVSDTSLDSYRRLSYIGQALDDELYVMLKRSELEYETPFCLCFMLRNHIVELPNVRIGIEKFGDKKRAHILAVQTTQNEQINKKNLLEIENYFKKIIPNDSHFRFYNPAHLVSILMCFGLLKGMGITDVQVADYLPFRHRKTVLDKQMSEEEAIQFQRRLTDKNMITYMRLMSVTDGIKALTYPEMDMGLKLDISGDIHCKNEELQHLYDMCYELSKNFYEEDIESKSRM